MAAACIGNRFFRAIALPALEIGECGRRNEFRGEMSHWNIILFIWVSLPTITVYIIIIYYILNSRFFYLKPVLIHNKITKTMGHWPPFHAVAAWGLKRIFPRKRSEEPRCEKDEPTGSSPWLSWPGWWCQPLQPPEKKQGCDSCYILLLIITGRISNLQSFF